MKRLHADVGAADSALQKTPEIFQSVSMYLAVHVCYGVVDHFMGILTSKPAVRLQRIAVQRGTSLDVLADFGLNRLLLTVRNHTGSHFAAALQDSHDGGLIFAAGSGDATRPLLDVHVAGLAADESFIGLYFAREQTRTTVCQGESKTVGHEPCGLLSDPEV